MLFHRAYFPVLEYIVGIKNKKEEDKIKRHKLTVSLYELISSSCCYRTKEKENVQK